MCSISMSDNNVIAICAMLRIFTLHWLCVDLDYFKSISLHNIARDAHSACRGPRTLVAHELNMGPRNEEPICIPDS